MSQKSSEAGGEELRAQDTAAALLRWVDSCSESPLDANELERLCALLKDAAGQGAPFPDATSCLLALLDLPLGPTDSTRKLPGPLADLLAFFSAHPSSHFGRWLFNDPPIGDVGRVLHACQDRGVPVQAATQTLLMGMTWFLWDAECRALYGSRGEEPLGLIEAAGRPGFEVQLLRLFGHWFAGRPRRLKALCVLAWGKTALPPRGRRRDLARLLTVYAATGRRPRHAALHRAVVHCFPDYRGSPAALRKLWSRVTRRAGPLHPGTARAGPQIMEDDFDWYELGGGGVIGLHRPTGIEEAGRSRAAVMAAVAERIRSTEGDQGH